MVEKKVQSATVGVLQLSGIAECALCRGSLSVAYKVEQEDRTIHDTEATEVFITEEGRVICPGCALPKFAWPGGYEIGYVTKNGDLFCARCAREEVLYDNRSLKPEPYTFTAGVMEYDEEEVFCSGCNYNFFEEEHREYQVYKECAAEGHDYAETSACAESGATDLRCMKCGATETVYMR